MNRNELIQNRALFLSKAQGCLIGLALGDAMGDAGRSDVFRKRYGIVNDLYDGLQGTDDTDFAVLTARTLMESKGHLTHDTVTAAWRKYILDRGGIYERAGRPLYGAVENLKRGQVSPQSGIDNVNNDDDGAAMRAAPIGIFCAGDPERAAELAEVDAQISHARDGVWAAKAVAASIALAIVSAPMDDIIAAGQAQIPADSWLGRTMAHALALCDQAGCIETAWRALHDDLWTPSHSASAEAIPQIYAILKLTGGDFHKGLFWSANFGRDADTISAVTCAVNGALHGLEVFPAGWAERMRKPSGVSLRFTLEEDLLDIGRELVDFVCQYTPTEVI